MATSRSQRITIWVIAAMMSIGSLGFYFLIIIDNNQQAQQQAELQSQIEEAQQQQESAKPLPGYKAAKFDASKVTKLVKTDLKVGKGDTVPEGATVKANYMGWTPDGKLFDSSFRGEKPEPIEFSLGGVIEGWQKGVPGMKVGGVRKLTIPADMAYGEQGNSNIPPNTPLTFIVEIVGVEKK